MRKADHGNTVLPSPDTSRHHRADRTHCPPPGPLPPRQKHRLARLHIVVTSVRTGDPGAFSAKPKFDRSFAPGQRICYGSSVLDVFVGTGDWTMPIELLPGTDNVIVFPVEMRAKPSMLLLHELRPDIRILFTQAEGLGFELPDPGLRDRTDEATAEHIAAHLDAGGRAPARFLDELLEPLLHRAIDAARKAAIAAASAEAARQSATGPYTPDSVKEHALGMCEQAVRLGLEAHALCEETLGVERAVRYAREGEPWVSRDHNADTEAMIAAEVARRYRL
jgi:hypothetical protein